MFGLIEQLTPVLYRRGEIPVLWRVWGVYLLIFTLQTNKWLTTNPHLNHVRLRGTTGLVIQIVLFLLYGTQGFPSNLKKKTSISKQNSMLCMSIACYQQNKLIAATSVCFLVIPDFLRYSLCIKQTRSPSHLNKIKTYLSSRRASSCTSMFPPPVPSTSYLAPPPPPYHISIKLGIQDGHSDTEFFSLLFSIFHIIHKIAIATSYSLQ